MSLKNLYTRFLIWLGAAPPPGYEEPLSKVQRIKYSFLLAAITTAFLLLVLFVLIFLFSCCSSIFKGDIDRVSVFSVIVDISIGVFTIWGLYWAASEFAEAQIKPDLHFIVGSVNELGIDALRNPTDSLIGISSQSPDHRMSIGLFLENYQPKAAQYIRITLRIQDTPSPNSFEAFVQDFPYYMPRINLVKPPLDDYAIFLQFDENLIVYKGDGVYLGQIRIAWSKEIQPPKSISLRVGLYNLVGEEKFIIISHPIKWDV